MPLDLTQLSIIVILETVHFNLLVMFFKFRSGCYGNFVMEADVGIYERAYSKDLKCEWVFPCHSRKETKLLPLDSDLRYRNTIYSMLNCCILLQQWTVAIYHELSTIRILKCWCNLLRRLLVSRRMNWLLYGEVSMAWKRVYGSTWSRNLSMGFCVRESSWMLNSHSFKLWAEN